MCILTFYILKSNIFTVVMVKQSNRRKYMKTDFYVEFFGKQVYKEDLVKQAKKIWTDAGNKASDLKSLNLYLKPEDNAVYYVFNDSENGSFAIDDNQNDF